MFWIVLRSGRDAFNQQTADMEESLHLSQEESDRSDGKGTFDSDEDSEADSDDASGSSAIDSEVNSNASGDSDSDSSSSEESEAEQVEEAEPANLDPMVVYGPAPPAADFTYKLKIFLSFLQIVTNLSSGLEVQWPNTFKDFVLLFNVVNMDFLFVRAQRHATHTRAHAHQL